MAFDGPYTLKRTPKVGDEFKFNLKADLTTASGPVNLTGVVVEKVVKVDADGTYSVEESQSGGKIKMKDYELDIPSTAPAKSRYKPNGEVIEFISEQGIPELRSATLDVFRQPDKPVKVGESWTWDSKGDAKLGTVNVRGIYTLVGEETIAGKACVKIRQVVSETEGSEPASKESTIWLEIATSTYVKLVSKWTNVPMSGGTPISGTVSLTRA